MNASHHPEQILNFAVRTGELMLKSGAETYRVEDTISRILETHHFKTVDTFVVPTGIMVTINDTYFSMATQVVRVKNRSSRLDRIELINQLSRDYVGGLIDLDEGLRRLEEIKNLVNYPRPTVLLWIGISCAFFSIMFNGNLLDFVLTFFIGLGVGFLHSHLEQKHIISYFILFLCALFIGFAVTLCNIIFKDAMTTESIVIGCIMPLLPGVAFTTAIRDAIGDELLSGICRGTEALLIAVSLAVGIGVSLSIGIWLRGVLC